MNFEELILKIQDLKLCYEKELEKHDQEMQDLKNIHEENLKKRDQELENLKLYYEKESKKHDQELENLKNIHEENLNKYLKDLKDLQDKYKYPTSEELSLIDTKAKITELEVEIQDLTQINKELKNNLDEQIAHIKYLNDNNVKLSQVIETQKKLIKVLQTE